MYVIFTVIVYEKEQFPCSVRGVNILAIITVQK